MSPGGHKVFSDNLKQQDILFVPHRWRNSSCNCGSHASVVKSFDTNQATTRIIMYEPPIQNPCWNRFHGCNKHYKTKQKKKRTAAFTKSRHPSCFGYSWQLDLKRGNEWSSIAYGSRPTWHDNLLDEFKPHPISFPVYPHILKGGFYETNGYSTTRTSGRDEQLSNSSKAKENGNIINWS